MVQPQFKPKVPWLNLSLTLETFLKLSWACLLQAMWENICLLWGFNENMLSPPLPGSVPSKPWAIIKTWFYSPSTAPTFPQLFFGYTLENAFQTLRLHKIIQLFIAICWDNCRWCMCRSRRTVTKLISTHELSFLPSCSVKRYIKM